MTDSGGADAKAKSKAGSKAKAKAGPKAKAKAAPNDDPTDDPFEKVTAAFADAGERLVEYADVWRSAIVRNAAEDYAADDFLVDLQTIWGMSVRDVTRAGTAVRRNDGAVTGKRCLQLPSRQHHRGRREHGKYLRARAA